MSYQCTVLIVALLFLPQRNLLREDAPLDAAEDGGQQDANSKVAAHMLVDVTSKTSKCSSADIFTAIDKIKTGEADGNIDNLEWNMVFQKADTENGGNSNGNVDAAEFKSVFAQCTDSDALLTNIFEQLDTNGDGELSAPEWDAGFAAMDIDGNGSVDENEWNAFFDCTKDTHFVRVFLAIGGPDKLLSKLEWETAFREADTGGQEESVPDDKVDKSEFIAYFTEKIRPRVRFTGCAGSFVDDFIAKIDDDKDQVISEKEWGDAFKKMDASVQEDEEVDYAEWQTLFK